jgi:subtilisin-like proprotein convertase family protein
MATSSLVAPDGTGYPLHRERETDGTPDLDQTWTVNLSGEARDGTWRLRVQDAVRRDSGYLDRWTLTL